MTDPKKMQCSPLSGQSLGNLCYLSSYGGYADVTSSANAEQLWWSEENGALYLKAAHYLGNQDGQAHWGSSGVKLDYNADGTISLHDSPSRKLYYKDWANTNDRKAVYWTNEGETHPNLLRFESGLVVTHDCRLSPDASGGFWEHSMNAGASWTRQRTEGTSTVVAYCAVEIPADAIRLKLKIHNNYASTKIRIYLSDDQNNRLTLPPFAPFVIDPQKFGTLEFSMSSVHDVPNTLLPYKTGGFFLDDNYNEIAELPDPKFTITRKRGG
jgi:hypothetical protein